MFSYLALVMMVFGQQVAVYAQESIISGANETKVEGPKEFKYVLKDEPEDIRSALFKAEELRKKNTCYYFFYKKTPGAGNPERFRRSQDCDEFDYAFED